MTLGADIAGALPELRAQAESRMTDKITAGLFRDGTDPVTGDPTRTLITERYTGVARVRYGSREVSNSNTVSMPVGVQEPYLSVPFGSARIRVDDEVKVTDSEDPILIGRTYRVAGNPVAGAVTAYRYPLEEL